MLTTEQLDALRTLAGWRRRLYEACDHEAYMLQQDAVRKPWFAPGSLDPFGNIWDEEATAPDWQTIRLDLAAALEADAVAPLGERGKVRGAVLEVVRDAVNDPWLYVHAEHFDRNGEPGAPAWVVKTGGGRNLLPQQQHGHTFISDNATLLAAIDHLAKQ